MKESWPGDAIHAWVRKAGEAYGVGPDLVVDDVYIQARASILYNVTAFSRCLFSLLNSEFS